MNADQLLERYTAEIDKTICEFAVAAAQRLLDAGAHVNNLPQLMRPTIQQLARWRATALAKLQDRAARMRVLEAQIELNNAEIERMQATVH